MRGGFLEKVGPAGLEFSETGSLYVSENKGFTVMRSEDLEVEKVHDRVHGLEFPPDLQKIIDCWDSLPKHIKNSIMALVVTAKHL